ncbi:MAG: hypothetical protein R3344_05225, partial [Acidobacteriota bacterium]|nr:hypothetical protein [Acidobacteriota bacterium]
GFVLQFTRRQYRNWQMTASYKWSKLVGNGLRFNPIVTERRDLVQTRRGFLSSDQRHVFKGSATTIVPWAGGFRFGGVLRWQSGLPYSTLERELAAEGPPRVRLAYVDGVPNDGQSESWWNLDLHIAKEWNLKAINLQLVLDVFNAFDDDALQAWRVVDDHLVATRRYGRHFQIGLRLAL